MPSNRIHIKQIHDLETQLDKSLYNVLNVGNTASQNILMGTYSIGIGTVTPTANLHLDGSLRLSDLTTTPSVGYVLQSTDASGNVDWVDIDTLGTTGSLNDLSDVVTGLPGSPTVADDGRMLHYNYTSGQWISDDSVNHGTVVINGKKGSVGTILKGTPLYLSGFDNDLHEVEVTDASSSSTMPVIGFASETLNDTDIKHIITFGKIQGIDTTSGGALANGESWSINDDLYVDTTPGELTNVRPIGLNTQIQRVAKVLRVDVSGGQLFIFNTARTAGLPNLKENNFWIGNNDNQPITSTFSFGYLMDVSLSSATTNDTLRYDGSDWVNTSNVTIDSGGNMVVQGGAIIQGDVTINGTTSTINTQNLLVEDPLILLSSTQSGSPSLDSGLMINRGTGITQSFIWDESEGEFAMISTNDTHEIQGNVGIIGYSTLRVGGFKMTDGTEESGYILTSDIDGIASWTASASLGLGNGIYNGDGIIPAGTSASITDTMTFDGGQTKLIGANAITTQYTLYTENGDNDRLMTINNGGRVLMGAKDSGGADYGSSAVILKVGSSNGEVVITNGRTDGTNNTTSDNQAIHFTTRNSSGDMEQVGEIWVRNRNVTDGSAYAVMIVNNAIQTENSDGVSAGTIVSTRNRHTLGGAAAVLHVENRDDSLTRSTMIIDSFEQNTRVALAVRSGSLGTSANTWNWYLTNNHKFIHNYGQLSTGDFVLQGLNDANTFFMDASTDRVGIGVAAPSEKFHVVGSTRLQDGTEGDGYILVSNATGVSSWTASASLGLGNGIYGGDGTLQSGTTSVAMGANDLVFNSTTGNVHILSDLKVESTIAASGSSANQFIIDGGFNDYISGVHIIQNDGFNESAALRVESNGIGNHYAAIFDGGVIMEGDVGDLYPNISSSISDSIVGIGTLGSFSSKLQIQNSGFKTNVLEAITTDTSTRFAFKDNGDVTLFGPTASMGIGTITPTETLHVNGTFRLQDGTQADGYVLISDVDGVASWTASSSGGGTSSGIYAGSGTVPSGVGVSLANTLSFDTDLLHLNSAASRVGVGTTSLGAKLSILTSTDDNALKIENTYAAATSKTGILINLSGVGGSSTTEGIDIDMNLTTGTDANGVYVRNSSSLGANSGVDTYISGTGSINVGVRGISDNASFFNAGVVGAVGGSFITTTNKDCGVGAQVHGDETNSSALWVLNKSTTTGTSYGVRHEDDIVNNATNQYGYNMILSNSNTNNIGMYIDVSGGSVSNTALQVQQGEIIFNNSQNVNSDFIVKGLTNSSLFHINVDEEYIGIGTGTPSETLDLAGTFRLRDGSEGSRYILACDSNGVASWTSSNVLSTVVTTDTDVRDYTAEVEETITHNLNTIDVHVQVYDSDGVKLNTFSITIKNSTQIAVALVDDASDVKTIIMG